MLGRNDYGINPLRLSLNIFHADLAFAIGAQVGHFAGAAHLAQLADQLVGQHDRQRHQFLGFVAGVTEHQALVARSAGIDTHRDIRRLRLNHVDYCAGFAVEAV